MSSRCLNLIRTINTKLNVKKIMVVSKNPNFSPVKGIFKKKQQYFWVLFGFFQFSNPKKPSWVFWVEFFMPTLVVGYLCSKSKTSTFCRSRYIHSFNPPPPGSFRPKYID